VQGPLTADLAPQGLTGRYMAVVGFSWQLGFVVGPAAAAAVLQRVPLALWALAAAACLLAGLYALVLERKLDVEHRETPRRPVALELR
jgi:MFS family permease